MYELWDTANMSIIDEYMTLEAVFADVREEIASEGPEAVRTWGILSYQGDSPRKRIAMGDELIALAMRATPDRSVAD